MKSSQFVPGRIYSVVYLSNVEMVSKRDGQANPLIVNDVTVRRVSSLQAAGRKTWANYLAKRGEAPAATHKSWWVEDENNSCIVNGITANTTGKSYLRGLPKGVTKEEFFIDGKLATEAEVSIIRQFKKSSGGEFIVLNLDKLENVESETGEAE